jgi:hypothetical protein
LALSPLITVAQEPSPGPAGTVPPCTTATTRSATVSTVPSSRPSTPVDPVRVRQVAARSADPTAPMRGRWESHGEPPIAPRTDAIVVQWPNQPFGTVIWGGVGEDGRLLNDGMTVDRSGAMRVLPRAPLCPRRDFAWVNDGSSLVIWGGVDDAGRPLSDGAAWSVDTGAWTLLAAGPLPGGRASMAGEPANLFVLSTDPVTGLPVLAHLRRTDPGEPGDWSPLLPVALPPGERYDLTACCEASGVEELVVTSVTADGFATAVRLPVYPVGTDGTPMGTVPLTTAGVAHPTQAYATERSITAWWTESEVSFPGTDIVGPAIALMDGYPSSAKWSLVAAPEAVIGDTSLVLSPHALISVRAMQAYDLVARAWRALPLRADDRDPGIPTGSTAWWADGRLWVVGGRSPDGTMERILWSFTPALPRGTFDLPGPEYRVGTDHCDGPDGIGRWVLRGDPRGLPRVWIERRGQRRQADWWPDGWTARFDPRLEIVRSDSSIAARDGDRCAIFVGAGG